MEDYGMIRDSIPRLWLSRRSTLRCQRLHAGFEYSDEDDEEQDVDIENQYYNSKGLLETDTVEALRGFELVVDMEQEKGEWYD